MSQRGIRLTSTFTTTRRTLGGLLAGMVLPAAFAWAVSAGRGLPRQGGSVAEYVQRLGTRGNNNVADVKRLSETPRISTRLLVQALHPVREARIPASESMPGAEHVLWAIRALRYVTGGKDFCAATKHKFGTSRMERHRKYWLYFGHDGCVSFFAMWPSRGTEYIAPRDAQLAIIRKWKRWFATYGATFRYRPLHNPKPWQWAW